MRVVLSQTAISVGGWGVHKMWVQHLSAIAGFHGSDYSKAKKSELEVHLGSSNVTASKNVAKFSASREVAGWPNNQTFRFPSISLVFLALKLFLLLFSLPSPAAAASTSSFCCRSLLHLACFP